MLLLSSIYYRILLGDLRPVIFSPISTYVSHIIVQEKNCRMEYYYVATIWKKHSQINKWNLRNWRFATWASELTALVNFISKMFGEKYGYLNSNELYKYICYASGKCLSISLPISLPWCPLLKFRKVSPTLVSLK